MNSLIVIGYLVSLLTAKCPRKSTPSLVTSGPECGLLADYKTCDGNANGSCCSSKGYCGNSFLHCSIAAGCYGDHCTNDNPKNYSFDGRCGPKFNSTICPPNTGVGECCSAEGYCGDSYEHCKKP